MDLFLLAAICGFVFLLPSFFTPWAYYLGGHFHWLPYWQGWGRVTVASAGGEYVLYVQLEPSTRGSRILPAWHITGTAHLCTPAGEHFRLRLGGSMPFRLNEITTGEPIHLYMSNSLGWKQNFTGDHRPYLDFYGTWADRAIVMDDRHSLSNAFLPDGTVYRRHDRNRPLGKETADFTLTEGTYKDFEAACAVKAK
jgi:hypothetical protein